jgi:hypothetical protein
VYAQLRENLLVTRLVWLFLFINVYWWSSSDNFLNYKDPIVSTISPLDPCGRVGVFKLLLVQLSNPEYAIILAYALMDLALISVSWACFLLLFFKNMHAKVIIKNLFKSAMALPILKKYALWVFTVSLAIPNRVFIYHQLNNYLVSLIVVIMFLLTKVFPLITLPLVFYLFLAFESVVFAVLYQHESKSFKNFIDSILFSGNHKFAQQYFEFFWGNMQSAGKTAIKTGLAGWLARLGWNTVTGLEDVESQNEAERRVAKAIQSSGNQVSPQDVLDLTAKEKQELMKEKPFSNAERTIKLKLQESTDKLLESYSKPKK